MDEPQKSTVYAYVTENGFVYKGHAAEQIQKCRQAKERAEKIECEFASMYLTISY